MYVCNYVCSIDYTRVANETCKSVYYVGIATNILKINLRFQFKIYIACTYD